MKKSMLLQLLENIAASMGGNVESKKKGFSVLFPTVRLATRFVQHVEHTVSIGMIVQDADYVEYWENARR